MKIIGIPTEQTTALTDFILGLLLAGILYVLYQRRGSLKVTIWLYALGLLCFASFLGAYAHGIEMSADLNYWLWQPLNLALGLVIGMFVVATCLDIWGAGVVRRVLIFMIVVAVIFYGVTVAIPGTFMTFVAYEAVAMLFALGGYLYLALKKGQGSAWWMVAGIFITIVAAAIQAVGTSGVVMFWGLDHNGVFHLVQMFGLLALTAGVLASLKK
jgi:hypothetical protein